MRRREGKHNEETRPRDRIHRYWVEIRQLSDGSVRTLPLKELTLIQLSRRKSEPQGQDEAVLQVEDGLQTLEARSFEDLAAQLRQKYPEEAYEGRLYWERDLEAEKRHRDALNGLISLIADSIVKEMLEARATVTQISRS